MLLSMKHYRLPESSLIKSSLYDAICRLRDDSPDAYAVLEEAYRSAYDTGEATGLLRRPEPEETAMPPDVVLKLHAIYVAFRAGKGCIGADGDAAALDLARSTLGVPVLDVEDLMCKLTGVV